MAQPVNDDLLTAGVELGYLSQAQVEDVVKRQHELRHGGITLPSGQVLLERRYLTPGQLKQLMAEVEYRRQAQPASAKARPELAGKKLGQYEILEVLSEKGRSRVFKARDTAMDRVVVLKVLPRGVSGDEQWAERFKREVLLAGKLAHPNIITAYGAGEVEGCPLMALEYLDGMSLGERLEREGNIQEKTAWQIGREVAKGLGYAASQGVLHRDIKPENILCSAHGVVKIIDMGLSKSMADDTALTAAGTTVGTPFYISPEQAMGTKDLDARTDVYSLGCTIFHMLTGSVPFLGDTLTEVMTKHTEAPRPDPREFFPEISEGSAKLVMRMMAINPQDRPQSAAEVATEIDTLLPNLPEPVEVLRPTMKIARSETAVVPKPAASGRAAEKPGAANVPKPSIFSRMADWFLNLFD